MVGLCLFSFDAISDRVVSSIGSALYTWDLSESNLIKGPKWPKVASIRAGLQHAKHIGKEAKYGFGRLIDLVRAEPVTVEMHGQPVVVVLADEE